MAGFENHQDPSPFDLEMTACSGGTPVLQDSRALLLLCGLAPGTAQLQIVVGSDAAEVAPVHSEEHHRGREGLVANVS